MFSEYTVVMIHYLHTCTHLCLQVDKLVGDYHQSSSVDSYTIGSVEAPRLVEEMNFALINVRTVNLF